MMDDATIDTITLGDVSRGALPAPAVSSTAAAHGGGNQAAVSRLEDILVKQLESTQRLLEKKHLELVHLVLEEIECSQAQAGCNVKDADMRVMSMTGEPHVEPALVSPTWNPAPPRPHQPVPSMAVHAAWASAEANNNKIPGTIQDEGKVTKVTNDVRSRPLKFQPVTPQAAPRQGAAAATRTSAQLQFKRQLPLGDDGDDNAEMSTMPSMPKRGDDKELKKAPKAVFADAAAMKEKLRAAIGVPVYSVANFYWDTGFWQHIARSAILDNVTLSVIAFNALWIAIDTDNNDADMLIDAHPVFQVAENAFCLYFSFEWFARFMAFRHKLNGLKDAWFVFDTVLVTIMVNETWVFTLLVLISGGSDNSAFGSTGVLKLFRLVRLTRMARMAKLFRVMPELLILIKGMQAATRSVFFTLCLLAGIVYVFAIAFVQLMGPAGALDPAVNSDGEQYFPNVPRAMHNLLVGSALPDHADILDDVGRDNFLIYLTMMLLILLAGITIMNMLVGVLCEVVSVVSSVEKEALTINFVKTQLQDILMTSGFDANDDGRISKDEFEHLLDFPQALRALQEVGVDVVGLVDFTDFIFEDGAKDLSFADFMDLVLQLRGTNTATVKDIVDLRKLVTMEFSAFKSFTTGAAG